VREWGDDPAFVRLLAERLAERLRDESDSHVVFTAHSLPARILEAGDTYSDALLVTSRLAAEAAGLGERWSFAFQSASDTGEPWLGPDVVEELDDLAGRGVSSVVVCPVGFVSDHLEILWDIDVVAAERARELGLRLARIRMPNADPGFVDTLAAIVRRQLAPVPAAADEG
jgi:ferrochelatase